MPIGCLDVFPIVSDRGDAFAAAGATMHVKANIVGSVYCSGRTTGRGAAMTPEDTSYFMIRAEQERDRARTCSDPAVAAAHRTLARRYGQLINEADSRQLEPIRD